MNSPIWTRNNAGLPGRKPGLPKQSPDQFSGWLRKVAGSARRETLIVLIGLTADCCVLSTAQELSWRGYSVKVLYEGTDTYSGNQAEKEYLFNHAPFTNWAMRITWRELKKII